MDSRKTYPLITWRPGDWLQQLDTEAARLGVKRSAVIRRALQVYFADTKRLDRFADAGKELERLRRDLYRVGSNLNQIAAGLNASEKLDGRGLASTHQDLQLEFKKIMTALVEIGHGAK